MLRQTIALGSGYMPEYLSVQNAPQRSLYLIIIDQLAARVVYVAEKTKAPLVEGPLLFQLGEFVGAGLAPVRSLGNR